MIYDIDTLCLKAVQKLMKDGASRKKLSPRDIRYQKRAQSKNVPKETKLSNDEDPSPHPGTSFSRMGLQYPSLLYLPTKLMLRPK